jgi:hypothetical protein
MTDDDHDDGHRVRKGYNEDRAQLRYLDESADDVLRNDDNYDEDQIRRLDDVTMIKTTLTTSSATTTEVTTIDELCCDDYEDCDDDDVHCNDDDDDSHANARCFSDAQNHNSCETQDMEPRTHRRNFQHTHTTHTSAELILLLSSTT